MDPTCPLCGKEIENRKHSITLCPVTETARTKFKQKIIDIMNSSTVTHLDVQNDDILLQIIVDCSALIVGQQYSDLRHEVETLNRELIYNVHVLHTRLMTSMHMPGRILFLTFNLIKLYLLNPEVGCTYTDWWNTITMASCWLLGPSECGKLKDVASVIGDVPEMNSVVPCPHRSDHTNQFGFLSCSEYNPDQGGDW